MDIITELFEQQGEITFRYKNVIYTVARKTGKPYMSNIFFDGKTRILKMVTDLNLAIIEGKTIEEIISEIDLNQ